MIFINSYTSFPAVVVASPYITTNLQAYYDFSNASSYPGSGLFVTDLSGMNSTLTFTAAPTFVSSPPYVVLTNTTYAQRLNVNLNFTTGMTFEVVYRTTTINYQYIVQYDDGGTNGFVIQTHPSLNAPYMNVYGTGISGIGNGLNTTNNSTVPNTWYHLVFTITSGGVWTSYLNSVNRAGGTLATYNPSVTNRTLSIGGNNSSTTNVGIFRVYDRALTSGEITQNFNTVKSTYTFDPFEYPPLALTGASTSITTASYGNGSYNITSSDTAINGAEPFKNFNKFNTVASDSWGTNGSKYNTATGLGIAASLTISSVTRTGEWVSIQLPSAIILNSYTIAATMDVLPRSPRTWFIAGSNNGTTWTSIDTQTNISWTLGQSKSFNVSPGVAYLYYLIQVTQNQSGDDRAQIGELRYFGF